MAEDKGYRAIVKQPTPDGTGFVDVAIERDGKRIACEISLTSTDDQELKASRNALLPVTIRLLSVRLRKRI